MMTTYIKRAHDVIGASFEWLLMPLQYATFCIFLREIFQEAIVVC